MVSAPFRALNTSIWQEYRKVAFLYKNYVWIFPRFCAVLVIWHLCWGGESADLSKTINAQEFCYNSELNFASRQNGHLWSKIVPMWCYNQRLGHHSISKFDDIRLKTIFDTFAFYILLVFDGCVLLHKFRGFDWRYSLRGRVQYRRWTSKCYGCRIPTGNLLNENRNSWTCFCTSCDPELEFLVKTSRD